MIILFPNTNPTQRHNGTKSSIHDYQLFTFVDRRHLTYVPGKSDLFPLRSSNGVVLREPVCAEHAMLFC